MSLKLKRMLKNLKFWFWKFSTIDLWPLLLEINAVDLPKL